MEFTAQVETGLRHIDGRAIRRQPLGNTGGSTGGSTGAGHFRGAGNAVEGFIATHRHTDEALFAKPGGTQRGATGLASAIGQAVASGVVHAFACQQGTQGRGERQAWNAQVAVVTLEGVQMEGEVASTGIDTRRCCALGQRGVSTYFGDAV